MPRFHGGALTCGEIGRVQSATLRLQPPDASRHVLVNLDLLGRCKSPGLVLETLVPRASSLLLLTSLTLHVRGKHEAEKAIQAAAVATEIL